MEAFGKFAYGLLILTIGLLIHTFVIYKLYNWLVVPIFNVEQITMGVAFALGIILAVVRSKTPPKDNDEEDPIYKLNMTLLRTISYSSWFLFLGWIATFFI